MLDWNNFINYLLVPLLEWQEFVQASLGQCYTAQMGTNRTTDELGRGSCVAALMRHTTQLCSIHGGNFNVVTFSRVVWDSGSCCHSMPGYKTYN